MTDTTDEKDISTSGDDGSDESTQTPALTSEQRDAATFAKYGMKPDGSELDDTSEDTGDDEDKSADGDKTGDDEGNGDEDADSDKGTAGATDADVDADTDPEITDEDVENVVAALEERLIQHPKLAQRIKEAAETEATRRFEEQRAASTMTEETERLIQKGRGATQSLYDLIGTFGAELGKAAAGEKYDPTPPNFEKVQEHLGEFGAAVVAETRRAFDKGFENAFRSVSKELGVQFSKEDLETMKGIFQTVERIEGDPKQGRGPAVQHLYTESWKLLAQKVKQTSREATLNEVKSQRDAAKKIKDDNAETAAIAKITRQRKKMPSKSVAAESTGTNASGDDYSEDAYRAAKARGDHEEADRIVQQRGLLASGRR